MMSAARTILPLLLVLLTVSGQNNSRGRGEPYVNNDSPAVTLLKNCDSTRSRCEWQLQGLMLGIDASKSTKDSRSICFPQGRFPDDPVKLFRDYVASHPDKLNVHLGHVMYQALLGVYPCKKIPN